MTTDHDRQLLLQLAREAIAAHVGVAPAHVPGDRACCSAARRVRHAAQARRAARLHRPHRGEPAARRASCRAARSPPAATDPRFPPVTPTELEQLDIEMSLLGPLEPIDGPGRHRSRPPRPGRRAGWQRGLLLPQVATEWGWDAETFLAQTCHKAGLPRDAWNAARGSGGSRRGVRRRQVGRAVRYHCTPTSSPALLPSPPRQVLAAISDSARRSGSTAISSARGSPSFGVSSSIGRSAKPPVVDDAAERLEAEAALADVLVAIDAAAERLLRVVQVKHLQPIESDQPRRTASNVAAYPSGDADVVARREQVAGVEADADAPMIASSCAMIDASCSNVAPSDVPWPAVCSSSTIVLPRRRSRSSSSSAVGDQREPVRFAARGVAARMQHDAEQPERLGAIELVAHRLDRLPSQRRHASSRG